MQNTANMQTVNSNMQNSTIYANAAQLAVVRSMLKSANYVCTSKLPGNALRCARFAYTNMQIAHVVIVIATR